MDDLPNENDDFWFAMLPVSQAHTKATLPPVVIDLAGSILTSPMRISIGDVNAAAPEVEQLLGAPRALGAGHRHKTCRKTNEANMETSYVCICRKLQIVERLERYKNMIYEGAQMKGHVSNNVMNIIELPCRCCCCSVLFFHSVILEETN